MLRSRFLACVSSLLFCPPVPSIYAAQSAFLAAAPAAHRSASLVVGDEPFAVRTGASILAQGGSAVDAVTATYFALSVTYPVAAGLGGGGICIVHDPASGRNEEFDFLAREPGGGGTYAVPGNVRGFAVMQSRYGALPWQRDVSPGEGYAATGFPISRALAARLTASQDVIRLDASLAAEFMDECGKRQTGGQRRQQSGTRRRRLRRCASADRTDSTRVWSAPRLIAYSQTQGGGIAVSEFAGYSTYRAARRRACRWETSYVYLPSQAHRSRRIRRHAVRQSQSCAGDQHRSGRPSGVGCLRRETGAAPSSPSPIFQPISARQDLPRSMTRTGSRLRRHDERAFRLRSYRDRYWRHAGARAVVGTVGCCLRIPHAGDRDRRWCGKRFAGRRRRGRSERHGSRWAMRWRVWRPATRLLNPGDIRSTGVPYDTINVIVLPERNVRRAAGSRPDTEWARPAILDADVDRAETKPQDLNARCHQPFLG